MVGCISGAKFCAEDNHVFDFPPTKLPREVKKKKRKSTLSPLPTKTKFVKLLHAKKVENSNIFEKLKSKADGIHGDSVTYVCFIKKQKQYLRMQVHHRDPQSGFTFNADCMDGVSGLQNMQRKEEHLSKVAQQIVLLVKKYDELSKQKRVWRFPDGAVNHLTITITFAQKGAVCKLVPALRTLNMSQPWAYFWKDLRILFEECETHSGVPETAFLCGDDSYLLEAARSVRAFQSKAKMPLTVQGVDFSSVNYAEESWSILVLVLHWFSPIWFGWGLKIWPAPPETVPVKFEADDSDIVGRVVTGFVWDVLGSSRCFRRYQVPDRTDECEAAATKSTVWLKSSYSLQRLALRLQFPYWHKDHTCGGIAGHQMILDNCSLWVASWWYRQWIPMSFATDRLPWWLEGGGRWRKPFWWPITQLKFSGEGTMAESYRSLVDSKMWVKTG